jgi:hypothetical protein
MEEDELQYVKARKWAVAIATMTFIAGAFHMAHTLHPLGRLEQVGATILVLIVAFGGAGMLFRLQRYIHDERLGLRNPHDYPWRGLDVVCALAGILIISAIVVCYSFWRA